MSQSPAISDSANAEFGAVAPAAPEQASVFYVLLACKSEVEAALVAIMKRAARRGLAGAFSWSWGRAYEQRIHKVDEESGRRYTEVVDRIVLVVEGETPRYHGWTFVAALDHMRAEDGSTVNVLRAVPGGSVAPVSYRTSGPVCNHCKTSRRRGSTYVLRHEDERYVQVGSTCIVDFLGHDALRVAALAEYLAEVGVACEDEEGPRGSARERTYRLDDVLVYVAATIRSEGWISRSQARDRGGVATAHLAMILRGIKKDGFVPQGFEQLRKIEITDADRERSAAAIAWALAIAEDTSSDYLHNVRTIARCNFVTDKTLGIAASTIAAAEREASKAAEAKAPKTAAPAFFGTVKKRETFVLTLVGVHSFETMYGVSHLYRFVDQNGSAAVWKASSAQEMTVGVRYNVKGTVKEHSEYKGSPQTVLTRCTVEGESGVQSA